MKHIVTTPAGHTRPVQFVVLSIREAQILRGICEGLSNKQLALALKIQPGTLATHIARIKTGLEVSSRAELVVWAMQNPAAMTVTRRGELKLHAPGCPCPAIYCTAMRLASGVVSPAA